MSTCRHVAGIVSACILGKQVIKRQFFPHGCRTRKTVLTAVAQWTVREWAGNIGVYQTRGRKSAQALQPCCGKQVDRILTDCFGSSNLRDPVGRVVRKGGSIYFGLRVILEIIKSPPSKTTAVDLNCRERHLHVIKPILIRRHDSLFPSVHKRPW
jgi:hypothetical protein